MAPANRLADPGDARRDAIALASELAALPQVCMREDRASSYAQWRLGFDDAIQVELEHGLRVLESETPLRVARHAVFAHADLEQRRELGCQQDSEPSRVARLR